jgi:hypothetical protein
MTVNNRTSNRDYPKPNVANFLSEDVVRLSEALDDVDADMAAAQASLATKANLASPTFTGTPAAPTATADTNTTQVATTAFVVGQASAANPAVNGTPTAGSSNRFARADHVHPTDTGRAPVESPSFTGTPTAPTPAIDTNTTQVATTAYVVGQNYTKQTRQVFAGTGLTGGGDLSANRTIAADVATQAEAEAGISSAKLMTPQRTAQALLQLPAHTITTTAASKTLANRERCTVTAAGQTITLPASPSAGWEVAITVAGTFTNTVIARNGVNIMSLAENMTIDHPDVTVTFYYVDATRGWRII